ncbi:MAG: glutathione synthase [Pseudomonadales bacterium]|jgi:glutathione synthase|nr:glutathione synthase [Pseudomonadales bacterium]
MTELGIVMDPVESLNVKKDSTLAMIVAARRRGWRVHYMLQGDLYLEQGRVRARMHPIEVDLDARPFWRLGDPEDRPLGDLDAILMRKDPPFDMEYVYATYMLERAEAEGVRVYNRPRSLRDCNEKFYATAFPELGPPLVVTRRSDVLRRFAAEHEDVILKPLDGMGGASIFRIRPGDPNLSVVIETLTGHGTRQIMAQRYIPEIVDGDKRILVIDGEPVPFALARIPAAGESRGNLAAGGRGEARPLSRRDREIAETVADALRARGLMFVGLDVIGDYLTEVNVTCPTCIRELDAQCGLDIAGSLMERIGQDLEAGRPEGIPAR